MEEKHCKIVSVIGLATSEKSGKYLVSFSDGSEMIVNAAQIADFELYVERELSADEYSEMLFSLKLSKAKSKAVNILGNRSLSTAEIKKRLIGKGESDLIAQETADWLEELGLIDDENYARSIVNHYASKGYGPLRIKDEMYRRGIPQELFRDVLSELDDSDVSDAAEVYLMKKLRGSVDPNEVKRATNALIRRGFSYEQTDSAIKKYKEENGENQ